MSINKVSKGVNCREFTVGVNVLIAYIETTVYVCCGKSWAGMPNTVPCSTVSEDEYEFWSQFRQSATTGSGLDITYIIEKYNLQNLDFIEIVSSTTVTFEENFKIKIKEGNYQIHENNIIYLDYARK